MAAANNEFFEALSMLEHERGITAEYLIEKIKAAIQAAYEEGESKLKGNGKTVPALTAIKTPLRDGDTERPDDPAYAGAYFVNANSNERPGVVDRRRVPITDPLEVRVNTVGGAMFGVECKIVDPETGEDLPDGVDGEFVARGYNIMKGYYKMPEATAAAIDADGWLHTGDLGKMDEDGFVYFSQRIKRMIITSGYNVYPGQLENIIDGHEKVLLSCVIGVKDPYKMQKVKAFVVLRPGYEPSEAVKQEILDYCRQHIAKYAMPYDIEFRSELPKTLVGKVAYRVLEEEEAERQALEDAKNS